MLAWPANNYWNTNFPLVQPGRIRLRYGLATHGPFDPLTAAEQAAAFAQPLVVHPAFGGGAAAECLLKIEGKGVSLLEVQLDGAGPGVLVHLVNLGSEITTTRLSLPGLNKALVVNALGEKMVPVQVAGDTAIFELAPKRVTILQCTNRISQPVARAIKKNDDHGEVSRTV